jgi:DNA (cytosine-5)-methyltransferase 1
MKLRESERDCPLNSPPFKLIDLFSGAGGLTLGFTTIGNNSFQPIWANDCNKDAVATYRRNFGSHCVLGDILEVLNDSELRMPEADVVIGGPPCQGFSLLNKNRNSDSRKQLWKPFLEGIERSNAKIFVLENVPQLLGSEEHDQIISLAQKLGYKLAWSKLCAADYGVPQVRWRGFIIGSRFADPQTVFPPKKTHYNPDKGALLGELTGDNGYIANPKPWRTVRDAIADLPAPESTEIGEVPPLNLQFGRNPTPLSLARYQAIPQEGMNRFDLQRIAPELTPPCWIRKKSGGTDLFGRLWWDKPSVTIRTEFFKPEKGRYLHPEQHRPLTHREAARLQSFPDNFQFCGSKSEIAKQIGNAVPPLLAAKIAECVYALLLAGETPC